VRNSVASICCGILWNTFRALLAVDWRSEAQRNATISFLVLCSRNVCNRANTNGRDARGRVSQSAKQFYTCWFLCGESPACSFVTFPYTPGRIETSTARQQFQRVMLWCLLPDLLWLQGYSENKRCIKVQTTSRKVAGSIPDGVIRIFHWHNPSGHTMALRSTQPLTEMRSRNIFWGYRRPVRRADNLINFMCRPSWNLRPSTS
jgi:hypothetical protein